MKKVLFVAFAMVIVSQVIHAQTGSILVGGSIDIVSSKQSLTQGDYKSSSFKFSPTIGYQFNDNWTAGVVSDIATIKSPTGPGTTSKETIFDIGPFIRYAKSISGTFALYGQLQGVFGTDKLGSAKSNLTKVTAFPAVFINVKNSFGLNFSVGGIEYGSEKPTGQNAINTFSLSFGRSLSIGISKNFGLRKKN